MATGTRGGPHFQGIVPPALDGPVDPAANGPDDSSPDGPGVCRTYLQAFVSVGLVDGMEVSAQADLACAHLCDDRADRSVCANMCGERPFSRPYTEFEELRFPGQLPSSLIVWRMMDFVVAMRVLSDSGSSSGSRCARASGLWPAASLAALSATSLIREFFESL